VTLWYFVEISTVSLNSANFNKTL